MERSAVPDDVRRLHLALLDEFFRICSAAGLRGWLWGGTLLGSVRGGDFVPWDDDIDVALLRKDYDAFAGACGDLADPVFATGPGARGYARGVNVWRIFARGTTAVDLSDPALGRTRRIPDGYCVHGGVYLDVFPIDFVPDDPVERWHFVRRAVRRDSSPDVRRMRRADAYEAVRAACVACGPADHVSTLVRQDDDMLLRWFGGDRLGALRDRRYPVPGEAERVLEGVYGPGWKVPDSGSHCHRMFIDLAHDWTDYSRTGALELPSGA